MIQFLYSMTNFSFYITFWRPNALRFIIITLNNCKKYDPIIISPLLESYTPRAYYLYLKLISWNIMISLYWVPVPLSTILWIYDARKITFYLIFIQKKMKKKKNRAT